MKNDRLKLLLLSIIILYLEILLIRWVGTEVNIFAYLQNAILVFCFLGLGLGCMKNQANIGIEKTIPPLLILTACATLPGLRPTFQRIGLHLSMLHDFVVWNQAVATSAEALYSSLIQGIAGTTLLAWAIVRCMLPLGIMLGRLFENSNSSILSYSLNILGSLLGVWIFTILGILSLSPFIWFGIFLVLFLWLLALEKKLSLLSCAGLLLMILLPMQQQYFGSALETKWSPYQKLELFDESAKPGEYVVLVNNTGYQEIQNNSSAAVATLDAAAQSLIGLSQYDIPSRLSLNPKKVLVVGGGTGNDVAGVLRNTDAEVDVIEIDPTIIEFGRKYHPEQPYSNPRVNIISTDARAYFNYSDKKYNLIIFGLLDSHTTQAMTNARLDHYVYTSEAIAQAKTRLLDGGVFVILFQPQREFIVSRLANVLNQSFGYQPLVFEIAPSDLGWGGTIFVTGNLELANSQIASQSELAQFISNSMIPAADLNPQTRITTDDWPYLYLETPAIPSIFYLFGGILAVLYLAISRSLGLKNPRNSLTSARGLQMFSLGAAFMLLETYGINQTAIVFGNTWLTNSAVISGVLITILFANLLASRFPNLPPRMFYIFLLLSCAILYRFHFIDLLVFSFTEKVIFSALLCGLPMLFSGYIFISALSSDPDKSRALANNFMGALAGGVIQVASFALGIKASLFIVAGFYCLALLADSKMASSNAQTVRA